MNPINAKGRGGALSTVMYEACWARALRRDRCPPMFTAKPIACCGESLEYHPREGWVIFSHAQGMPTILDRWILLTALISRSPQPATLDQRA